jgi:hypothetical protein
MRRSPIAPGGRSTAWKVLATSIVLGLVGVLAGFGTWSAFSGTTSNDGNSFAAGTVTLTDDDANAAMFAMSNLKPGDTASKCIVVTFTGSLPSNVRLYGTTTGTGLDQYLDLKVTRGTVASPAFPSCTTFVPDVSNYIGAGLGVIFNGTLQGYPDDYAGGLVDPTSGSPESWTTSEAHAYKFDVTVQDNDLAQSKNATEAFIWQARNS